MPEAYYCFNCIYYFSLIQYIFAVKLLGKVEVRGRKPLFTNLCGYAAKEKGISAPDNGFLLN